MPPPTNTFAPDEPYGSAAGLPSSTPTTNHGGYNPDFPSAPFAQPATSSWPPSDSLFDLNNVELFAGFDIPFWLDDEQYVPFLDNSGM